MAILPRAYARPLAPHRLAPLALLVAVVAAPVSAQGGTHTLAWTNEFMFYGENTEFFNPYVEGQTLLGANFSSALSFRLGTGSRHQVLAGVFGIMQSGDTSAFLSAVRPVLSYRYHLRQDIGVLGTLITEDRHGYLPNLEATNLDILRPIEYGAQWIHTQTHFEGQVYLNWQAVNTSSTREVIDYGWLLTAKPLPWAHLDWQVHGLHRGGQLYSAGEPVRNNLAGGLGVRLQSALPVVDSGLVWAYRFWSSGNANLMVPDSLARSGSGTFVQVGVKPKGWLIYGIWWWGNDYLANEGDPSYNSVTLDSTRQSKRTYRELGILRRATVGDGIRLEGQFRFTNVGDGGDSTWEHAYRLIVWVPFDVPVWREREGAPDE